MVDPVVASDGLDVCFVLWNLQAVGHTYERYAIEHWLVSRVNATSPLTNSLLKMELTPNITLRSLISELKKMQTTIRP